MPAPTSEVTGAAVRAASDRAVPVLADARRAACRPDVATTGGKTGVVIASGRQAARRASAKTGTARSEAALTAAPVTSLVGAGIYRRAQVSQTATFTSSGSLDGWILESSHTSNKGGTMNSSASTIRLGDDKSKRQYRSILSFATSGLPDSAVITGVTLSIRKQGITGGGNPVSIFKGLLADVKNGYFGTTYKLQTGDFQASANKTVGAFKPAVVAGWYSLDLTGARGYVNKTGSHSGLTQLRLRFKLDDNNNKVANLLSLYSGSVSAPSRPQLAVTYYVP